MTITSAQSKFKQLANSLQNAAINKTNVLLRGERGVGKTQMILDISKNLNLTLKYFSASTLDPFADLVGIPVPKGENIQYMRSKDINEAQFMFFDELNRAHKRVTNAVFEIIQFKALNGEVLENLQMVWAAINPWEDEKYDTEKLDEALQDRFHIQIDIPYTINPNYFTNKYDSNISKIVYDWWEALTPTLKAKISPRRMDYLIEAILNEQPYKEILPFDTHVSLTSLVRDLKLSTLPITFSDIKKNINDFKNIIQNKKNHNEEFMQLMAILMNLQLKQLIELKDLIVELPNDYLSRILFRNEQGNIYQGFRKGIFKKYGVEELIEIDNRITERLV